MHFVNSMDQNCPAVSPGQHSPPKPKVGQETRFVATGGSHAREPTKPVVISTEKERQATRPRNLLLRQYIPKVGCLPYSEICAGIGV
jgi:hypothetical protein